MDLIAKSKLPKLTTRPKCITFKPYTPPQIADIIKNKHANVENYPLTVLSYQV